MQESHIRRVYLKGFIPYALAAFLIGFVGGLTTVLGPAFVKEMNLDYNNTTWTALSLSISSAVFTPILGILSDSIGRRKTLLIGISIFILGNILTATAFSLISMIIARFIVGIGTAAIAPTVISYIITEFPTNKIAKGFSLYMLISSAAVIFGPTAGGIIINKWNFRILMWVCVIISIVFLILCFISNQNKDLKIKKNDDFDKYGFIFIVLFFSFLLCIPSFGQNFGWNSPSTIIIIILAIFSLIGLIISEKKTRNPALSFEFIFRKSFILSIITLFLTQGLMQANMTNVIVFVNYTNPDNTVISGYAISIMYLGMSIGSIILGPLTDKYEPKRILSLSLLLTAIGCAIMLLFSTNTEVFILALSLGILGFGLGGNASIFMKVVLSNLEADKVGSATGTYGLFRDLTVPFGVAIFVPLFTNQITNSMISQTNIITSSEAAVKSIHTLSIIEISFVIVGIILVQFLPKIHNKNIKEEM